MSTHDMNRATASATSPALPGIPAGTSPGRGHLDRYGQTERIDAWWLQPVAQALGLLGLIGYANWAAFQGNHYLYTGGGAHYLSPFYSPTLKPAWWPISPAFLILIFPLGFRTTCYYYRKAYYRAFFNDPAACAVGERSSKGYCGEARFPFLLQNIHRYFLYAALVFLVILWWDVIKASRFEVDGRYRFGIGGGTLAILASTGLLTLYTLSCHSLRHLVGGRLDCFSCAAGGGPQQKAWGIVSLLNARHMAWAWWSLFAVCFADFYVRMCSMGIIRDAVFFPFNMFNNAGSTGL